MPWMVTLNQITGLIVLVISLGIVPGVAIGAVEVKTPILSFRKCSKIRDKKIKSMCRHLFVEHWSPDTCQWFREAKERVECKKHVALIRGDIRLCESLKEFGVVEEGLCISNFVRLGDDVSRCKKLKSREAQWACALQYVSTLGNNESCDTLKLKSDCVACKTVFDKIYKHAYKK